MQLGAVRITVKVLTYGIVHSCCPIQSLFLHTTKLRPQSTDNCQQMRKVINDVVFSDLDSYSDFILIFPWADCRLRQYYAQATGYSNWLTIVNVNIVMELYTLTHQYSRTLPEYLCRECTPLIDQIQAQSTVSYWWLGT